MPAMKDIGKKAKISKKWLILLIWIKFDRLERLYPTFWPSFLSRKKYRLVSCLILCLISIMGVKNTLFGIHSTKYDEFLFWTFSICSSTSFIDIRPLKTAATVRYLPWRGSHAAIIFLASNICCVSSGTVSALYCCEPRDVNGANPGCCFKRR